MVSVLFLASCENNSTSEIISKPLFTEGIEGPAVSPSGDLYIVNFNKQGTIGVIKKGQRSVNLFLKLPEGSIGNGIRFLNDSIFYVADYAKHQILKVNANTKGITVHAANDLMNQPNDIAISVTGVLFASDPNWEEKSGNIWRINTDGSTHLLDSSMGTANGIEVSTDEQFLYVNESVQRKIWKYNLTKAGEVSNKSLFFEFDDFGMDGMRCDEKGNLFVTRYDKGTVVILSPDGVLLNEVKLHGTRPTNVAFGGIKGQDVFVTMQGEKWVESFKSEFSGRSFKMHQKN
tara:strand:- start:175 stop:1041 length:867 start_codon:yes stop_codon:yes gene_type:complete